MSVVYLTEDDVTATLHMADALALLDDAARKQAAGEAMNQPRVRVRTGATVLHVLCAAMPGFVGHKSYTSGPQGAKFWYTLYAETGKMLAIIEADRMGAIRTGAASGLATRALARAGADDVGIIGTGYQARTQLEAICAVTPIARIRAFGRDESRRTAFAHEVRERLNVPVEAVASAQAAVEGADIVVTMTSSAEPVVKGAWLGADTHVNAAGANRPTSRELDTDVVARASRVVVEDVAQARTESLDLARAVDDGVFAWESAVSLSDVLAGTAPGRGERGGVTLFKSLGIGLWDLAVARFVYEQTRSTGLGRQIAIPG